MRELPQIAELQTLDGVRALLQKYQQSRPAFVRDIEKSEQNTEDLKASLRLLDARVSTLKNVESYLYADTPIEEIPE